MPNLAGKVLIITGLILIMFGLVLIFWTKIPFLGKMPGDLIIEKNNIRLFFPLATCLLISLILTVIFNIVFRLFR